MNVFELFAVLKLNKDGFETGLKGAMGAVGALATAGVAAATAGVVAITKEAVSAYASYEQLAGGVETLFGAGGKSIEEYAASTGSTVEEIKDEYNGLLSAQSAVMENASEAYKTAGMSANDYMTTVTSFSAALISSMGGDTEAAAEKADMAITDMSDNANKMGSDMEAIENAYKGFSKQNFTLLDNLQLGYGGTKEEMERLLSDAEKLSGVEYDISSYSDIVDAIHVVQTEMGITGTTAEEASSTIEGSLASTKAAWENLLTGLGNGDNIAVLMTDVARSATDVFNNIMPVVEQVLTQGLPVMLSYGDNLLRSFISGMMEVLPDLGTSAFQIVQQLITIIIQELPTLVSAGVQLLQSIVSGIVGDIPELVPAMVEAIMMIIQTIVDNLPEIIDSASMILLALANGLIQAIPTLLTYIPTIVQGIADALVNNAPMLLYSAVALIVALAGGLLSAAGSLLDSVIQIMEQLGAWIEEQVAPIVEAGKNIVVGLWNGINDKAQWIKDKVTEFVTSIGKTIKDFFGIASPSKLMKTYGEYIVEGLAIGIEDEKSSVDKAMDKLSEAIQTEMDLTQEKLDTAGKEMVKEEKENLQNYYDVLKGYSDKLAEGFDDITTQYETALDSINSDYESALSDISSNIETLADKMYDYGDLFTTISDETGEFLQINDIQTDIDAINAYGDALMGIKERGIDEGLMSEILDLGMDDATEYINQLLEMSDEDFDKYNDLWEQKQEAAQRISEEFYQDQLDDIEDTYSEGMEGIGESMAEALMNALAEGLDDNGEVVFESLKGTLSSALSESMSDILGISSLSTGTISASNSTLASAVSGATNNTSAQPITINLTTELDGKTVAQNQVQYTDELTMLKGATA